MSPPTKILPFSRPKHKIALPLLSEAPETFPRFRREWNRPTSPRAAPQPIPPIGK